MQQIRVSKVSVRSKSYNPDQPRVPAGQEGGGRWTGGGDWDELPNYDENYEVDRITEMAGRIADDIETRYSADEIAEILTDWAFNNNSRGGVILQIAAHHEFGAPLSGYTQGVIDRFGININADWSEEQAILRAIQQLSTRSAMTLYRGKKPTTGINALESWTASQSIARFYAAREGDGIVVKRRFEPDEILADWRDGMGLEAAREVVVIRKR